MIIIIVWKIQTLQARAEIFYSLSMSRDIFQKNKKDAVEEEEQKSY